MKFLKYITLSSKTPDELTFRSLNIGIVEKDDLYVDVIKKYQHIDILETIEKCNKQFKNILKGKYKFGFYIKEEENINHLDINTKKRERIFRKIDEFNNDLAIIQKEFERTLQRSNLHNDT
jgi:hypothetical protein